MHGSRETSGQSAPETAADRREKAQSRTACMHAPEESDRGVVPKSRPNNEAQAKAEGEEGRPRIKENASPTHTSPAQNGKRVSQGLAGVRQAALTPRIQDKSRMREIRSYGSVRGALGNQSPYRDRNFWLCERLLRQTILYWRQSNLATRRRPETVQISTPECGFFTS